MAETELENTFGFVDKRNTQANAGSLPGNVHSATDYNDVSTLRAKLTALNGTYYTAARLNGMTKNDMVYALRVAEDSAGI